jgi:hypothetical protein
MVIIDTMFSMRGSNTIDEILRKTGKMKKEKAQYRAIIHLKSGVFLTLILTLKTPEAKKIKTAKKSLNDICPVITKYTTGAESVSSANPFNSAKRLCSFPEESKTT